MTSAQFGINGKTLNVFCISLQGQPVPAWATEQAHEAFTELASYLHNAEQVLYIRDIPELTIENTYPGGHCYNAHEAMIAVKDWNVEAAQLKATIYHELHHMARWQNPGYGDTLGGALVSEGIATLYDELRSGFVSPWANGKISEQILTAALESWDDKKYKHHEWFFNGPHGKWIGYSLGYRLAKNLFKDGFDLETSILITPDKAKQHLTL